MKTVLLTGSSGFIGSYLAIKLLKSNEELSVVGIDNMNDYYDVSLKEYRLKKIEEYASVSKSGWTFIKGDISDRQFIDDLFKRYNPDIVVNLAAQAGVRYSITNPDVYINSNIIGFYNILEACRHSMTFPVLCITKVSTLLSQSILENCRLAMSEARNPKRDASNNIA